MCMTLVVCPFNNYKVLEMGPVKYNKGEANRYYQTFKDKQVTFTKDQLLVILMNRI